MLDTDGSGQISYAQKRMGSLYGLFYGFCALTGYTEKILFECHRQILLQGQLDWLGFLSALFFFVSSHGCAREVDCELSLKDMFFIRLQVFPVLQFS